MAPPPMVVIVSCALLSGGMVAIASVDLRQCAGHRARFEVQIDPLLRSLSYIQRALVLQTWPSLCKPVIRNVMAYMSP